MAKEEAEEQGLINHITWSHSAFQHLEVKQKFDFLLAHAVLEWLNQPEDLFKHLNRFVNKEGLVSLMFYNFDALVFHNLVRGNFKKINNNDFSGIKGG